MKAALLSLFLLPLTTPAAVYSFTLGPGSAVSGDFTLAAAAAGTLTGNYDAATNATGTRTKPGLFGTFGAAENVPVPVSLTPSLTGTVNSPAVGGFLLDVDVSGGTVALSGMTMDLLTGGPASLPAQIRLLYDSFRTASPTSLYIGGIPFDVPFGTGSLTSLEAAQLLGTSAGTLTPAASGLYDFSLTTVLLVTAEFDSVLGTNTLPVPVGFTFTGQLDVNGPSPVLTGASRFTAGTPVPVGTALPQFPLALPTILPAGDTANLLFDLTLDEITPDFTGSLTLSATGVPVPEPGPAALAATALLALGRWRK